MLQQSGNSNMGGGGGSTGGGNNMANIGMPNMNQGMNMNNMGGMGNEGATNNQGRGQSSDHGGNFDGQKGAGKSDDERARMLRELKEDIARQEREANELEASLESSKRKNDDDSQGDGKRVKKADEEVQNATSV